MNSAPAVIPAWGSCSAKLVRANSPRMPSRISHTSQASHSRRVRRRMRIVISALARWGAAEGVGCRSSFIC